MKTVTSSDVQDKEQKVADYKISSHCDTNACVGVRKLGDGSVEVVNTASKTEKPVVFTKEEWRVFIEGAKDGEFDLQSL